MNPRTVLIVVVAFFVLNGGSDAAQFRRRTSRAANSSASQSRSNRTERSTTAARDSTSQGGSASRFMTNEAVGEEILSNENFLRQHPFDAKAKRTFEAIVDSATAAPRDESYAEFADVADIDGARYLEETGELVLWGPRIDSSSGIMPPLLHRDDLVAALRVLDEGSNLGVSIGTITGRVPTPDDLERALRERKLPIEYIPASSAGSHAASVLYEADRWLKVLSHGRDNLTRMAVDCPVPGHKTMGELLRLATPENDGHPHPIGLHWFEPEPTGVAFEGYTIKFFDYKMRCKYKAVIDDAVVQEAVQKFGDQMSARFADYAREYGVFRELVRLHKLVQVARWYKESEFPYERLLREHKPLCVPAPTSTKMLQTEISRTKRYQYMMFGGVDLSPPNYYVPATSVPQAVLVPGAAPTWEPTATPTLAAPPQYGSFAGPVPAPQFAVSLMEARPAATSTTWVVKSQGIDVRVVAIPVHELLPDEIPRGTPSMVASGFAARESGDHYTAQVQTQLKKAYSLSTDGDRVMDFAQAMQVAAPSLPTLSFAAREDSSPWMKFRLNTFGTRMDGIVFSSPLATRADLAAVIVVPGGVNWHFCVLPFHVSGHGARRGYSAANIRVSGIDLPEENQANFVTMDTGAIEPGQQCIVFFSFEQDEPVDVWLSMRLFPTRTISPPRSQNAVAKVMGIALMDGPELSGDPESASPVPAPDDGAPMIPPPPPSPPSPASPASPDVTPIFIPESRQ